MKNITILVVFFFLCINALNLKAMEDIDQTANPINTQKLQFATDFIRHEKTAIYVNLVDFQKIKGWESIQVAKISDYALITALMYAIPSAYIDVQQASPIHKVILSRNGILLDNNDPFLSIAATFIAIFDFSEVQGAQDGMIRFLVTRNEKFTFHFVETRKCLDSLISQTNN